MKRRIFKKIAAIALTAAVTATNIGMTSAAAEELPVFEETVSAVDVGAANAFDSDFEAVINGSHFYVNFNSSIIKNNDTKLNIKRDGVLYIKDSNYQPFSTPLTNDQLKLFYFSTVEQHPTVPTNPLDHKIKGLTVSDMDASGYVSVTLDIPTYMEDVQPGKTISADYHLWCPVKNANGTVEQKCFDTNGIRFIFQCTPMRADITGKTDMTSDNDPLANIVNPYTNITDGNADHYKIYNKNDDDVSEDFRFIPDTYSNSIKLQFATNAMSNQSSVYHYNITEASNAFFYIKRVDSTTTYHVATVYFINNKQGATTLADIYQSQSAGTLNEQQYNTLMKTAFPSNFSPIVLFNTDNLFQRDYTASSSDNTLILDNSKDTFRVKLKAASTDTVTQNILDNLSASQMSMFHFALSQDNTPYYKCRVTAYDPSSKDLTFTIDLYDNTSCANIVKSQYYLTFPIFDINSGAISSKTCTNDGTYVNGHTTLAYASINIKCPPAKYDLKKMDYLNLVGYNDSTIKNDTVLKVYNSSNQEVDDFELSPTSTASGNKQVKVKIKSNSSLKSAEKTLYSNDIYTVKKVTSSSESVIGTFYILNTTRPYYDLGNPAATYSGGSTDPSGGTTEPDTPEVPMIGSILQLPASKTAVYNFSIGDDGKLKCGSEAVKSDSDSSADITISGVTDYSKVKWVLETPDTYPKVSGKAKFKGANDKAVSEFFGKTASIIKTTANKQFNSTVILKIVSDDYKAATSKKEQAGTVYARKIIYITPEVPTEWTDITDEKLTKSGFTKTADVQGYEKVYGLSVADGKSVKIPFAPKNGADRSMVYETVEGDKGFSVVNGTVKALAGGCTGDVVCYPKASPAKKILIHVTTTAVVNSLRANTKKVTIYSGTSQTIYLGTNPPSLDTIFTVDGKSSGTFKGGTWSISGNALTVTGGDSVTKNTKDTLTVSAAGKTLPIKIESAAAPPNGKSFKLTTKKLNADGFIELNIAKGSSYNLGVAMNPATADHDFSWKFADAAPQSDAVLTGEYDVINKTDGVKDLQVSGDVIKGNKADTYYMQATSAALSSNGEAIRTPIYKINVYEPGSTVVMAPLPEQPVDGAEEFAVVGGVLMSKLTKDTTCDNYLVGGKTYTFPLPTTAGAVKEEIVWSTKKPAAISIDTVSKKGYMVLTPLQTGTVSVTGTTKYTKQNLTFKVMVKADDTAVSSAKEGDYTIKYLKSDGTWAALDSEVSIASKQKMNVCVFSSKEGAVGTVKFKTTTTDNCGINSNGLVTAKKAGTAKISAEVTLKKGSSPVKLNVPAEFTVAPIIPQYKSVTVPSGAVNNTKITLSAAFKNVKAKEIKSIKWEYADSESSNSWTPIDGAAAAKSNFTINIPEGEHYVRCNADGTPSQPQKMTVYAADQKIKSASMNCGTAYGIDSKLAKSYNDNVIKFISGSKEGAGTTYGYYYLLVFAAPSDSTKTLAKAGLDDIEWSSSNANLANAEAVKSWSYDGMQGTVENQLKQAAYAIVKIDTTAAQSKNYTGKVTITGVLKNSGKKVSVTLNLRKEASGKLDSIQNPDVNAPRFGTLIEGIDLNIELGSFTYHLDQEQPATATVDNNTYIKEHYWALSDRMSPGTESDVVNIDDALIGIGTNGSCSGKLTLRAEGQTFTTLKALLNKESETPKCYYLLEVYTVYQAHTDGSGTTWENDDVFHTLNCGIPFKITGAYPVVSTIDNITPNDKNGTVISLAGITTPAEGESYGLFYDAALTESVPATDIDVDPVTEAGKITVFPKNNTQNHGVQYAVFVGKIAADGTKTLIGTGAIVLNVNGTLS